MKIGFAGLGNMGDGAINLANALDALILSGQSLRALPEHRALKMQPMVQMW